MLHLGKLASFIKVAECGSFSRAALVLDMAHSGLSRQVLELETELGYKLLQRTGRGVRLTEQGQQLYEKARHLIALAESVHDEARALRGVPIGTVTIGMPGSVAVLLGSRLLVEASTKYPQVKLRIIEGLSWAVEEMLATARLDFALFFAPLTRPVPHATALFMSDLYLIGSPGDPLLQGDSVETSALRGLRLILPGRPNAIRVAVEDACAAAAVQCDIAYEADSLSTMKRAIEVGAGYTVASWDAIAREVDAGLLGAARLVSPGLRRVLYLQVARQQALTIASRAVLQEVRAQAAALLQEAQLRLQAPPDAARPS